MAIIIRAVFVIFWLVATGFIGFLAYIVTQTEANPQALWAWLIMCAFSYLPATFLAYNIVFGHPARADMPHHHNHLAKG